MKMKINASKFRNNESGSPLAFTVAGGMGGKGRAVYSRLAALLSLKNGIEKSSVTF